jgi:hypothetical protein
MITIFSNPRPFRGPFDLLQRNAIRSWLLLRPACEVILFNDEENTTARVAEEFGIRCLTDIVCDEFGTPLLNHEFATVKKVAKYDILAHVNSDIILLSDFTASLGAVLKTRSTQPFFMVGQRWDLDVREPISFADPAWEEVLRRRARSEGKLHPMSGMDYWVFPRTVDFDPPPFVVGRWGMDSWLVYRSRMLHIPVIDATSAITIVHQNHDYPQRKQDFFEIETQRNRELAGGYSCMMGLRDADWILAECGLQRPPFPRRIYPMLSLLYPWRMLLAVKRKIQERWT